MPLYRYTGFNSSGKTISGVIDSESPVQAKTSLKETGIFLSEPLREGSVGTRHALPLLKWERRPGLRDLSTFTYQLRTLLLSGLPMVEALTVLVEEERNARLRQVLADVRDRIRDGEEIAKALSMHPEVFNGLYVNMVAAGDAGGMLEEALDNLSSHLERQERISSRVRAAMTYPVFMAITGSVILSYLLASVVPRVVTVFSDLGRALPLPTQILIGISGLLSNYWPFLLIALTVIIYLLRRFSDRGMVERFIDRVPYMGETFQSMHMARFGRTMEALLKGGVPLPKALEISGKAVGSVEIERMLLDAQKGLIEGKALSESLKTSGLFPRSAASLIRVGETGGNLEDIFARIGTAKEKELDARLDALLTLLEPAMILVMGVVVGFIVLAILLPVFEMSQVSFR